MAKILATLLLVMTGELAATNDCKAFVSRYERPVAISASPISADMLGGRPSATPKRGGERPRIAVGLLTYRGYGIAIRSSDPRMAEVAQLDTQELGGRCSYQFWGPTGWNAFDPVREPWTLYFQRLREPLKLAPNSTAAKKRGFEPILAGYRTLSTWPIHSKGTTYYLGLMAPLSNSRHSVIVAFSAVPANTVTIVLAHVPMRFDTLSITPGLHDPHFYLNLEGLARGPELRRVVLEFSEDQAQEVGKRVNRALD